MNEFEIGNLIVDEEVQINDLMVDEDVQIENIEMDVVPRYIEESVYQRNFLENEWEQVGQRYQLLIPRSQHKLTNVYVLEFLIDSNEGRTNAFYSYTVLPNDSVRFLSDIKVSGKYILKGDR